jgi:hypothetical protein
MHGSTLSLPKEKQGARIFSYFLFVEPRAKHASSSCHFVVCHSLELIFQTQFSKTDEKEASVFSCSTQRRCPQDMVFQTLSAF